MRIEKLGKFGNTLNIYVGTIFCSALALNSIYNETYVVTVPENFRPIEIMRDQYGEINGFINPLTLENGTEKIFKNVSTSYDDEFGKLKTTEPIKLQGKISPGKTIILNSKGFNIPSLGLYETITQIK